MSSWTLLSRLRTSPVPGRRQVLFWCDDSRLCQPAGHARIQQISHVKKSNIFSCQTFFIGRSAFSHVYVGKSS
jgi:hypothetical protein